MEGAAATGTTMLLLPIAAALSFGAPAASPAAPAGNRAVPVCGDLLARLGRKPAGLRFTGCKPFPDAQGAPLRATYEVAGRDAAAVEAALIRTTRLHPLRRSCCQWDSEPASFDADGGQYMIWMVSEETAVRRREAWAEIGRFEVTVERLTTEI